MTTENIFAHEKYIGATVYLGKNQLTIISVSYAEIYKINATDKHGHSRCFTEEGLALEGQHNFNRLSWVKQNFVLGEPPKPKLTPLEFKGIPVLAYVKKYPFTDSGVVTEAWVIGYKNALFVHLTSSNCDFLEAILNQDYSHRRPDFSECKCAWEIPE